MVKKIHFDNSKFRKLSFSQVRPHRQNYKIQKIVDCQMAKLEKLTFDEIENLIKKAKFR